MLRNENRFQFLSDLQSFHKSGKFHDLSIVCGTPPNFESPIECHQLVMSSLSPVLCRALMRSDRWSSQSHQTVVVPDYPVETIKAFVDQVYEVLSSSEEESEGFGCSEELAQFFGLGTFAPLKYETNDIVKVEHEIEEESYDDYLLNDNEMLDNSGMSNKMLKIDDINWCLEDLEEELVLDKPNKSRKKKRKAQDVIRRKRLRVPKGISPPPPKKIKMAPEVVSVGLEKVCQRFKNENDLSTITVDIQDKPLTDSHVQEESYSKSKRRYYKDLMFEHTDVERCLLGVKKVGDGTFECKPLLCSNTEVEIVKSNIDVIIELIRHMYGLRLIDMWLDRKILKHLDFDELKYEDELLTEYEAFPGEEIQSEKTRAKQKLMELMVRPDKIATSEVTPGSTVSLVLKEDLDEFEEIIFLQWSTEDSGELICHNVHFNQMVSWTVFTMDIWTRNTLEFLMSHPVRQRIMDLYKDSVLPRVIEKVIRKQAKSRPESSVCPQCGEIFFLKTYNQRRQFERHVQVHKEQDYQCDCNVELKGTKEKRNHFNLFHSGEDYKECPTCGETFKEDALMVHIETQHKTFVCDSCGYTVNNKMFYDRHFYENHKLFKCENCEETLVGRRKFLTHRQDVHSIFFSCEYCPSKFKHKNKMKLHILSVHASEKDKRFQCKECEKGFMKKKTVRLHYMSCHVKTRPFKCRYGCPNVDYNDPSNRTKHERKHHGRERGPYIEEAEQAILDAIQI